MKITTFSKGTRCIIVLILISCQFLYSQNFEINDIITEEFIPGQSGKTQQIDVSYVPGAVPIPTTVEIIDDYVIVEGDVILGTVKEIFGGRAAVINVPSRKWPNSTIPYTIAAGYPESNMIHAAINHLTSQTNICMVPRTTEANYVEFTNSTGCSSYVGMNGGKQIINVSPSCGVASTVHEILHAAGHWHEQSRSDRDNYITININNVPVSRRHNFNQYTTGADIGNYDYGSIMHYGPYAFSNNGKPTIEIKSPPGSLNTNFGQRVGLSAGDISAVNQTYTATPSCSNINLPPNLSCKNLGTLTINNGIVTISGFEIENTGSANMGAATAHFYYLNGNSAVPFNSTSIPALTAGSTHTIGISADLSALANGTYPIGVWINAAQSPTEATFRDNNFRWNAPLLTLPLPTIGCPIDRNALIALYNATNGANWTNSWDLSEPINTWYGISTNSDGCVVSIILKNNNLIGTIPAEIGNLEQLQILRLENNQLSGSIPSEVGNLAELVHLQLNHNQLSGQLPSEIGNLSNLTHLELSVNQLSGTIPVELGNLSKLIRLLLGSNQLSGSIPIELGNLNNLYHIRLDGNQLSGSIPKELGNIVGLWAIQLYNNQLTGSIPSEFGNLVNLTVLDLQSNLLSGSIPKEIGYLVSLIELKLFNNQLTGCIPEELGNLSNLRNLIVNDNQLSGCFPNSLAPLCSSLNNAGSNFANNPALPGGGDFAAFCASGTGSCATCTDCPSTTMTATAVENTNTSFTVSWNAVTTAITYEISYRPFSGTWISQNTTNTSYQFTGLMPGATYEYQVRASCSTNVWTAFSATNLITLSDTGGNSNDCTNISLDFDGAGDYVKAANNPVSGDVDFTVEAWFLSEDVDGQSGCGNNFERILGFGGTQTRFELGECAGVLTFYSNLTGLESSGINTLDGNWHHVAATKTGNNIEVFLDGVSVIITSFSGTFNLGNTFRVGRWHGGIDSETWNGQIDEVRVWNFARSLADIIQTKDNCLNGSETGLITYYNFNQGVAEGDNTGVTVVPDISSAGNDGTFHGMALTGATSNFVNTAPFTANCKASCAAICTNISLDFDGAGDYVQAANNPVSGDVDFTVEAWFLSEDVDGWSGCNSGNFERILGFGGTQTRFEIGECGGVLTFYSNLTGLEFSGVNTLDGNWHHVAATKTGNNIKVFLDGISVITTSFSGTFDLGNTFRVGRWHGGVDFETWDGQIDEVRVWNFARPLTDILQTKDNCLSGNETGLITYYNFNEGIAEGDNTGMTVVSDISSAGNDGTFHGMSLIGTNSNFVNTAPFSETCEVNCTNICTNISLDFDGAGDFVKAINNPVSGNVDFTVEGWFLSEDSDGGSGCGGNFERILGFGGTQTRFEIGECAGIFSFYSNLTGIESSGINTLDGNWHHVAAAKTGNNIEVFLDGVSVITTSFTGTFNLGNTFRVGRWHGGTDNETWAGQIDEIRLWDFPRPLTDILQTQNQELTGNETGLITYYNFNQGTAEGDNTSLTIIPDLSPTGNDGTLLGFDLIGNNSNFMNSAPFSDCTTDLVWPGDFNNDGVANNLDALIWGLACENTSGLIRPNATSQWNGQAGPDWTNSVNNVNNKHQDGDGNGIINVQDLQVLVNNYGKTHPVPASNSPITDGVALRLEPKGYIGNATLEYDLFVELDGAPISLHGIALTVDFGDLLVDQAGIDITNSSLNPNHHIAKFNELENTLDIALTRTNKTNQIANGPVGTMFIVISDNIGSGEPIILTTKNSGKIVANGTYKAVGNTALYDTYSDTPASDNNLLLAASIAHEQCDKLGTAELFINGGVAPYTIVWSNGANTTTLSEVQAGFYSVSVTDANGLIADYTVEIELDFVPIYDENGQITNCNPIADCLSTISLENDIPNGIHQSVNTLVSSGIIATNEDITFKAGESITLQPGFTVEAGADFLAIIEACASNAISESSESNLFNLIDLEQPRITPNLLFVEVYPNPVKSQAIIDYVLPEAGPVHLVISDLHGSVIKLLVADELQDEGEHQFTFNSENFAHGMYFITLKTRNQMITKKVILLK